MTKSVTSELAVALLKEFAQGRHSCGRKTLQMEVRAWDLRDEQWQTKSEHTRSIECSAAWVER